MTKFLLILMLLISLPGPKAYADVTAKTDFYFPMQFGDYAKIITSQPLEGLEKTALPRFEFKKPFKTTINNTTMEIAYAAQITPNSSAHGSFAFNLDITESRLLAESVSTNDVVEKYMGGIFVSVALKGQCTDVGFNSVTPSSIGGVFEVSSENGRLVAQIQSLAIKGMGDWRITVGSCDGPVGYQQALEGELRNFLKDQKVLADLFKNQLQAKLNTIISDMTAKVLVEREIKLNDNVTLSLTPIGLVLNKASGQLLLNGELTANIASSETESIVIPSTFTAEDEKLFPNSGFVISQHFVNALSTALYKTSFYKFDFLSNSVAALKDLFSNKFYQFFLWRDLMKFKNGTPFQFKTFAKGEPVVSALGSGSGYTWFTVHGLIGADMQAPSNGQYAPYMKFQADTRIKTWMGVHKGKAVIGFQDPEMSVKKAFDPEYLKNNRPSDSMSLGFFVKRIKEAVVRKRFVLDLPVLELSESQTLTPKAFASDKKWLQLVYQPTTGN